MATILLTKRDSRFLCKKMIKGSKLTEEHKRKIGLANRGVPNPKNSGENNFQWRGKLTKYSAKHSWVRRKLGTPNYCEICKKTDKKKYEWANKDHKYSREIDDYMRLCTSCHQKYDILNNNYKGFWWNSTKIHPTKKNN